MYLLFGIKGVRCWFKATENPNQQHCVTNCNLDVQNNKHPEHVRIPDAGFELGVVNSVNSANNHEEIPQNNKPSLPQICLKATLRHLTT